MVRAMSRGTVGHKDTAHKDTAHKDTAQWVERLLARPGVVRMSLPAGQALFYAEQLAPGLYLVFEGSLHYSPEASHGIGEASRRDARRGPFLVPELEQLDRASEDTVTTAEDVKALFISRTAVLLDSEVRGMLEQIAAGALRPRS